MTDRLGAIIGGPDPLALQVSMTLCDLIVTAGELGELPTRTRMLPDGSQRDSTYLPAEWLDRLANAADRGAFQRYSTEQIVQHILSQPAETAP